MQEGSGMVEHEVKTKQIREKFLACLRIIVCRNQTILTASKSLVFLFSLSLHPAAHAQARLANDTLYDVYRLSSEASVEVDNDLMLATLVVQEEDKDAAILANRVNASMSWALNVLRPYNSIAVKTRDYQTFPRYDKSSARRLIGWRAVQSIELETDDFSAAGKAIQALQEKLTVQGINLSVKPATREKASDLLIRNALNSFTERASLVQRTMSSAGFRVLEIDIQTESSSRDRGYARMMTAEADSVSSVESAPAIAGGSTTVYVRIDGRVQLD